MKWDPVGSQDGDDYEEYLSRTLKGAFRRNRSLPMGVQDSIIKCRKLVLNRMNLFTSYGLTTSK